MQSEKLVSIIFYRINDITSLCNLQSFHPDTISLNGLKSLFDKHILNTFLYSETAENIYLTVRKSQNIIRNRHKYSHDICYIYI